MTSLNSKNKNTIMMALYARPIPQRIQSDIMNPLGITLIKEQIDNCRSQLIIENIIKEELSLEKEVPVIITPHGYKMIERYGSYIDYKLAEKNEFFGKLEHDKLQRQMLKVKITATLITVIMSVISFIAGILLSNPIKSIFQ